MSETKLPFRVKNLKGIRFPESRLVPREFLRLQQIGKPGHSSAIWLCDCDCGKTCEVMAMNLKNGHTKSCGCLQTESRIKHGKVGTPEYAVWLQMRDRCNNSNNIGFRNYGARGIRVCEKWNSFENFLADMGPRPSPKHSIDRYPDNNGNYEPGNCRWATKNQQCRNTRHNRLVTFNDITLKGCEWDEVLGLKQGTITGMMYRKQTIGKLLEKAIEALRNNK